MRPGQTPGPADLRASAVPPSLWGTGRTSGIGRLVAALMREIADVRLNMVTSGTATLTASTATTATITYRGQSISGVPMLASYTPTNGDTVILWITNGQMIVIGRAK